MTLIELLMVISIMTLLMAVAIPAVRPAFKDRTLREAARQVNTFIAGARARAQAVGRPVGVWIERLDGTTMGSRSATMLYMAEVAPPFMGGTIDSRVMVMPTGNLVFSAGFDGSILATMVAVGETFSIKFDHKGFLYIGDRLPDVAGNPVFQIVLPTGVPPGASVGGPGLPFEITRAPVRSPVKPLELPGDAVIDLGVSGYGTRTNQFDSQFNPSPLPPPLLPITQSPVIITFTPAGNVDWVFVRNTSFRPFGTLHLLIGRRAQVVDPWTANFATLGDDANLSNLTSLWVSIGHQTGRVLTAENDVAAGATLAERIRAARSFARDAIRMGGQ